jgi:hypothetical protein
MSEIEPPKTLSEILKARYVSDFVEKFKELGKSREDLVNIIEDMLTNIWEDKFPDIAHEWKSWGSRKHFIECSIKDALDETYGGN